jgi:hypothetical protein
MSRTDEVRARTWTTRAAIGLAMALALLTSLLLAVRPAPASAGERNGDVAATCTSPIGPQSVDIPYTATSAPDAIGPGEQATIALRTGYPPIVSTTTYWVNWTEATWPLPPQVDEVDDVTFSSSPGWTPEEPEIVLPSGGDPGSITVRYEGGEGTSSDPGQPGNLHPTPTITITVTVDPEDSDYTLVWRTFSAQATSAQTFLGTTDSTCTPDDGNQVLNSDTVVGTAPVQEFSDVPPEHPFFEEITWLAEEGIATGYDDGTFKPANTVSRQAMAAFLYRLAGEPEVDLPEQPTFSDVPEDHPFYVPIEWAVEQEIASGYPDGTFKPSGDISRQAMSAFVYRDAGEPSFEVPSEPSFSDVPEGHPFYVEIEWLAEEGISTGYEDGTFKPGNNTSRQATAAVLFRYAVEA